MRLVVDASVVAKWLFPETNTREARLLLSPRHELCAPGFVLIEAANVIWEKARRGEIANAGPYLEELGRLGEVVALLGSADLALPAAALAIEVDHPVYDCVYLVCAEAETAPLVTADERLARRAALANLPVDVWNIGESGVVERIHPNAPA